MPFVTEKQAQSHTGRAARTLHDWRTAGLPYVVQPRIGKCYRTTDLDKFSTIMSERSRVGKGRPRGSKNRSKGNA